MKISIVTPSYNQGQYIEDAIKSVLAQNYENFEHIIVDACSSDNTLTVLKKYPHLKWVSEPDEGQSDALNKGFEKASGDIIGWLNADDYFLPNAFLTFVKVSTVKSNIDFFYSNYLWVDKNKKTLTESRRGSEKILAHLELIEPDVVIFSVTSPPLRLSVKMIFCSEA